MIKGIIFDFDGLMVDTETVWYEAFNEVFLEQHGVALDLVDYSNCIGTGNDVLYPYFHRAAGKEVDCELMEDLAAGKFQQKMLKPVLREGVIDYLEEAKKNNLKIALASSSSSEWVVGFLEKLQIRSYFEVINTKEDVAKVKPDPELYTKTLSECGLLPEEAVVFEDSLNGLRAAKSAGIRCVVVPNSVTKHLAFDNHDYQLESMSEEKLIDVIERLAGS